MPRLVLREVGRTFGAEPAIVALSAIDLDIPQGAFLAIEGPSGSGKSTLLNQIALIDAPTSGHYDIDQTAAGSLDEPARARLRSDTFGFIFQNFHLMARCSAVENVELGLLYRGVPWRQRRERALAAVSRVGLSHRAHVEARKLSGGERQRVAIARATLSAAPIIVADEPTGNLDSRTGGSIVAQLAELNATGSTVVIVTHDPEVAARAPAGIVLRDGEIVHRRPPMTAPPVRPVAGPPGRPSQLRLCDALRESWRALRSRPGRTALLTAAVGIAVALVLVTVGLTESAAAQVSSSFDIQRNRDVTIHVPPADPAYPDATVPADVDHRLATIRGLTGAGRMDIHEPATATTGATQLPAVNVIGASPGLFTAVDADITWADPDRPRLGPGQVLIGAILANELELGPLDLSPLVRVGGIEHAVAGIVHGSRRLPELASVVTLPLSDADAVSDTDSTTIYITTVGGAAPQVARQAPILIDPVDPNALQTEAPPDPVSLRDTIEGDVRAALLAVTVVALFAAILGVANSMLLSVIERLGELGLRRAIGARPAHILTQTSLESVIAGLLGGLVGLATGTAAILLITIINRWQPVLDLRLVPAALAGGAVVGILGGLPASWRASRIQPADALRQ